MIMIDKKHNIKKLKTVQSNPIPLEQQHFHLTK
jgi:hypothetical protein